ncbi:MAG: acyloxyacyl hydrolase [Bacteroidia bacterium]|nr:acyloxyacyl hydrolase [Bacteroidia bacterium]
MFVKAQDSTRFTGYFAEPDAGYGFIVPHHKSMRYLQRGHIPAFNLRVGKSTDGNHEWEQLYRYPSIGIGYYYANLQYPEVLGTVNALYSFIDIPIFKMGPSSLFYNFSFGLSWLSKHFDEDNNIYNIAIGSHGNVFLNLALGSKIDLTRRMSLLCGIALTHYSNGAIASPNLGINVVTADVGLRYYPEYCLPVKPKHLDHFVPKFDYMLILSGGWKQIDPSMVEKYLTSSLSFQVEREISRKKNLGAGLDLFYDRSITRYMEHEKIQDIRKSDDYRPGVHVAYSLVFGKVNFTIQMGYYCFVRWNIDGDFYHRFGLQYYFSKHLLANLTIKTHFAKADFIEWGLGYRIN